MNAGHLPARVLGAVLLTFGCAVYAGCGQAGIQAGSGEDASTSGTVRQTTSQVVRGEGPLTGTGGDDVLRAGDGNQVVRGMGGDDEIRGGEGRDRLYGGPGDDVIDAQDRGSRGKAGRDGIFCGPGRDEVLMDAEDGEKLKDCEMAGIGTS